VVIVAEDDIFDAERLRTAAERSEVGWSDWLAIFLFCFHVDAQMNQK
jgi:hypothetical protein